LCTIKSVFKSKFWLAYDLNTCLAAAKQITVFLYVSIIHVCRAIIAGGGAPETELSINLAQYANTLSGMDSYCVRAFSEAMEVVPYTLAENAGLNPIATVTELRNKHAQGEKNAGINVRKVRS
jgi:chaperonin GroEL (HSP60 family)